jgi:hypothetical protein
MSGRFGLGRVVVTPAALKACTELAALGYPV